ncbi:Inactive protein kinase [Thalictrum thalictroides]|uniref:non-specific serine/threonine protein kinase n=1 Tax=Thalictrum thalictroides TaxID=46969 RepID=A0A7J6WYB0_THATH|nr:Inactive protein kinase [Thalictrum thalictroides]
MANVGENSDEKTPVFELKLYIVIGICMFCVLASVVAIVFCLYSKRNSRKHKMHLKRDVGAEIPIVSKKVIDDKNIDRKESSKMDFTVNKERDEKGFGCVNKDNVIYIGSGSTESTISADTKSTSSVVSSDTPNIGWGQWYTLKELEIATGGFSTENVVGEGGYGIVYRGILPDNSVVAVKNLLNQKGQAEKEFKVEVEAIGKVRHKNLVSLIGYCAEGTRRCVAPEYASTGMLREGSDVYSFGVLLMEMISGRSPVDYTRPAGEVNMVDWFKGMVASRRGEEVLDPLIKHLPSSRALKRALLVCLRCLDLDASKRPKMGQVVHMLEGDDFPFRAETRSARDKASSCAGATVTNKNSTQS